MSIYAHAQDITRSVLLSVVSLLFVLLTVSTLLSPRSFAINCFTPCVICWIATFHSWFAVRRPTLPSAIIHTRKAPRT